ncbi:hypothetical protein PHYBLDRAFT_62738 [Phycomyces blakesleeanus NRRL 1555(-)]|uniref:Uncharacterized protein n=1 Tax=Phycomyces blakesleeanus (strain ATCC 8743b / DSM 1359 / FGSC 10004 / NBRC 33097 / NRRL 1555) TaxID=763407 RepID=A0A162Y622_PHYB8|nr:hypothetical protein PHYBLDRAFT_62738 [Phycomyces blakesleeanus NRRL 1555(-)]OAD78495.1 hypothetical protein PHYBLDRAFT_62738 [Phycomyces blakesleeanus NRRL 1555(-)]|eukprot:XP_018296535.1 hypothetical protein PHYBLDRAFT_62738 [Phycomyces blakesleeanus NRRL 1555(-)]
MYYGPVSRKLDTISLAVSIKANCKTDLTSLIKEIGMAGASKATKQARIKGLWWWLEKYSTLGLSALSHQRVCKNIRPLCIFCIPFMLLNNWEASWRITVRPNPRVWIGANNVQLTNLLDRLRINCVTKSRSLFFHCETELNREFGLSLCNFFLVFGTWLSYEVQKNQSDLYDNK